MITTTVTARLTIQTIPDYVLELCQTQLVIIHEALKKSGTTSDLILAEYIEILLKTKPVNKRD